MASRNRQARIHLRVQIGGSGCGTRVDATIKNLTLNARQPPRSFLHPVSMIASKTHFSKTQTASYCFFSDLIS